MLNLLASSDIADVKAARRLFYGLSVVYFLLARGIIVIPRGSGSIVSGSISPNEITSYLAIVVIFVLFIIIVKNYTDIIAPRGINYLKDLYVVENLSDSGRQQIRLLKSEIESLEKEITEKNVSGGNKYFVEGQIQELYESIERKESSIKEISEANRSLEVDALQKFDLSRKAGFIGGLIIDNLAVALLSIYMFAKCNLFHFFWQGLNSLMQ